MVVIVVACAHHPISLGGWDRACWAQEVRVSLDIIVKACLLNENKKGAWEAAPGQPGLHSEIPDQKQTTQLAGKAYFPITMFKAESDLAMQT